MTYIFTILPGCGLCRAINGAVGYTKRRCEPPVFPQFFHMDNFNPTAWYDSRRNYT